MKTAAIQSLFIALAAAAAVQPKVSYDGHKVFRVPVVDDGSHVKSVLDKLNIHAWQQPSRKGAFADIQVAPKELDAFYKAMQGQQLTVMHEDLGQSIAQEGTYQSYAGMFYIPFFLSVGGILTTIIYSWISQRHLVPVIPPLCWSLAMDEWPCQAIPQKCQDCYFWKVSARKHHHWCSAIR